MKSEDVFILDENSEELGIAKSKLMENAGAAVAREAIRLMEELKIKPSDAKVLIVAGTGNNGGDGFVAARHLTTFNVNVTVALLGRSELIRTDIARENWAILKNLILKVKLIELKDSTEVLSKLKGLVDDADLIIDAILGTGVKGSLREPVKSAVEVINDSKKPILAIDTPTGVDPDTGTIGGTCIKATATVTFHEIKDGLIDNPYAGKIIVAPIGIPYEATIFVGKGDAKVAIKKRKPESHKGDFGYVMVIGGSKYFTGAPTLSALAALRTGVDVVFIVTPHYVANTIRGFSPAIIVREFDGDFLNENAIDVISKLLPKINAVVFGPGLGLEEETEEVAPKIFTLLKKQNIPTVIDADALKILSRHSELKKWQNAIITPHLGEFKPFVSEEKQSLLKTFEDRMSLVKDVSKEWGFVVLLKGHYDIISDGTLIKINRTGNPGMTVGGTGDVLTGIVGALLANGVLPFRAACVGAYLNGRAGDIAASKMGYHLMPTDVVESISEAIESLFYK